MRKLVQSDKAIKILSNPTKSNDLRRAVRREKSDTNSRSARSGSIIVRRVGK